MISWKEKALIHIYRDAAGLPDSTYRRFLRTCASVPSSADPEMSHAGFRRLMAALEAALYRRVDEESLPDPSSGSRWIRPRGYWRSQLPRAGMITRPQAYKISALWSELQIQLDSDRQTPEYLAGIMSQAAGRDVDAILFLTYAEAGLVMAALSDRLAHAVAENERLTYVPSEEVPF